jgi:hypothetical protein
MNRLLRDMIRLALVVLLPLLLALAPAMAQNVAYQGDTTPLSVVQVPGNTYKWEIYNDGTVNFAAVPGNCPTALADFVGGNTGSSVTVKWFKPGIYFFKVTAHDAAGCTMNLKVGMIKVEQVIPTAIITPPTNFICVGDTYPLEVVFTGNGPWKFTYTDGTNSWTVDNITAKKYTINVKPNGTTVYSVTNVQDQYETNTKASPTVTLVVKPLPVNGKIYQYEP